MRFISMHSSNAGMEAGEPPSAEVMAGMGPLMGEMIEAGVFVAGEGLRPTSVGVRLSFANGKRTITKGPFAGTNELIDRYLIVRVHSIDEAIDWATRFASGVGDSEIDVRPVTEMWDIGLMPKPAGESTTRYMILHKSDASAEAGRPTAASLSALDSLTNEMNRDHVLLSTEALQPSAKGVRLKFAGGQRRVIDGPFTESKELIAGYSIMDVKSIDEVIDWASRFAALIGDVQIEIRPLYEPAELR
jgi:hypothetical protein